MIDFVRMTQNSKWVTENVLWTLTCEPPLPPQITSIHKIHIFIFPTYLPFVLSLHFLFVTLEIHLKSLQIVRYNIHMLCCHITFKSKIFNVHCESTFLLKRNAQLKIVLFTWPLHNIIEDRRGRQDMTDRIGQIDRIVIQKSLVNVYHKCQVCVLFQDLKVTTYQEKRNCILYDNRIF